MRLCCNRIQLRLTKRSHSNRITTNRTKKQRCEACHESHFGRNRACQVCPRFVVSPQRTYTIGWRVSRTFCVRRFLRFGSRFTSENHVPKPKYSTDVRRPISVGNDPVNKLLSSSSSSSSSWETSKEDTNN
jgi:hypothetical protein